MKIKEKIQDCRLSIKVKLSFREKIDEKELDFLAVTYLRGFLKPRLIKKSQIEYTGPVSISLYERLKKTITKRDFYFIVEQIVVAVQKIESNSLSLNRLFLDIHHVYINEVTKEMQFLYVPTLNETKVGNVMELLDEIIYSVLPEEEEDKEYVSRFVYFFKGLEKFQGEKIEAYIFQEDQGVVNTIKRQNVGQSGFMTNKPQHYYEHYSNEDEEATGLLDEEEGTSILQEGEATGLLDEETGLLHNEEMGKMVHYPSVFRVLTEEEILINKPVFRIGKEKSYVDYFVTNNNVVSRSHADIVTRGEHCFVIDLNSKNRTYINNQSLPIQVEVEIQDGDRLRLGNEEFIFHK